MRRVAFATLGCKVNQYDTETMATMFREAGYEVVPFDESADVYVVNTCTVTSTGDKKSRQMLRRAVSSNPNAIVVATGCYAQGNSDDVRNIDGVDIVTGTKDRKDVVRLVEEAVKARENVKGNEVVHKTYDAVSKLCGHLEYEELLVDGSDERSRAYVKIEDGCDNFCTYCKVPHVRGPVRSRNMENIRKEVERLVEKGYREIILTGVHLSLYGKDLGWEPCLADVLKMVAETVGVDRVRLSSVDPGEMNDRLIDVIASTSNICNHIHMPLQAGDDGVLKRMNRHYTSSQFEEIAGKLKKSMPDMALTTDIIVGFPGEDDQAFENTMSLVRRVGFSRIHVFKYSKREGTPAANFSDQVSEEVKNERSTRLIELGKELSLEYHRKHIGKIVEIIVERIVNDVSDNPDVTSLCGEETIESSWIEGVTCDYVRVFAHGQAHEGEMVKVLVESAGPELVVGKVNCEN